MSKVAKMRGLENFITDIRACTTKEEEARRVQHELSKIREKFGEQAEMSGYDRRKYVWKLLYIHILGYKIEFGFRQACDMIPKPKYKDKQVGYMACSTLLNENDDFLRLAINGVHVDLTSRNEAFECLALTFIGSVGGQEMAEALIPDIMKLLQQSGARPLVKKRAALCLLRMVRKTPVESQVINPDTFCSTLNNLLEEVDLGLLLSTVTLLGGILARSGPEGYETCQSRLIRILERLTVNTDAKSRVPAEYLYYGIPSPWVQSKCLRALQYYPVPEISSERNILNSILNLILIESPPVVDLGKGAGTNKSNAQHAILFEAIALTLTLEGLSPNLLNAAIAALGSLVNSKDANLKLLAMENLSRLSTNPQVAGIIRQNQAAFIAALKDPDVTIRKPALDLVVAVCDQAGSSELITDILKLIPSSEPSVREDLTKKVTTLIDKFSTTPQSYIEQTLGVMEKAGDVVGEEVWLKFVQRVGANPNDIATRKTAVRGVYEMLRRGTPASEPVACIAAYIFGDHGMMIRDEIRPSEQFRQINTLFPTSDAQAKTIIVFSAIKIHLSDVADASLKYDVTSLYERYSKNLDAEMQQRASQYLSQGAQPQANIDRVALPMPKWVAILTTKALASAASAPFPPAAPPAAPTAPTAPTHARAPSFNLLGSESVETSFSTGISSSSAAVPAAPAAPRAPLDLLSDLFSDSVAISAPAPAAPPAAAVNPFTAYSNPAYAPPAQSMAPVVAAAVVATNPFVSLPPAPAAAAPPPPGLPYSTSFGGAAYPPGGLAYPPAPAPAPVAPAAPPALPYATSFGAAAYPPVTAAPAPPPALPYAASFGAAAFPPAPAAFPPAPAAFPHAPGGFGGGGFDDPFGDNAFAPPALPVPILPPAAPIGDTKSWFSLLLHKERGILYEDQYIQVGVQAKYTGGRGEVTLFLGNKHADLTMSNVVVSASSSSSVAALASALAPLSIQPKQQVQVPIHLACLGPVVDGPSVRLGYSLANLIVDQPLELPVASHKFLLPEPSIAKELFFEQWKLGVPPNKAQDMVARETPLTSEAVIGVLRQAGLGVEHAYLDPSPYNEAGAAYFFCGPPNGTPEQQQKVLVMCRVEGNPQNMAQFRVTVVSHLPTLSTMIKDGIVARMMGL